MKNETVKLQREKKTEMAYVEMKADAKNINRLFVWHGKSNPFFFFKMFSFFPLLLFYLFLLFHSNVSISVQECNLCACIVTLSCYRLPFHILFHKR